MWLGTLLLLAGAKLGPAFGVLKLPLLIPGGLLALVVLGALDFVGLPLRLEGVDGPVLFAGAAVLASFLFWWLVVFIGLTARHRGQQRAHERQNRKTV